MQHKRAKDLLRAAWTGDSDALTRIRALHPQPPAPDHLRLADAQLVIARGYGFTSWSALKRRIESLTKTPVEQFISALHAGDVERVRTLLETHAEVSRGAAVMFAAERSSQTAGPTKQMPLPSGSRTMKSRPPHACFLSFWSNVAPAVT